MIPKNTVLQTHNYQLRIPDASDFDFVFSATRYPGFNDGMLWDPPQNKQELIAPLERSIQKWEAGIAYNFTILSKTHPLIRLGRVSIRKLDEPTVWDVGYWIHPEHQGKGVITEALATVLEFGFSRLGAQKVMAAYATWNKASEKVLKKNGFQFVQLIEKAFQKKKQWVSENEYELTKEDWRNTQNLVNR